MTICEDTELWTLGDELEAHHFKNAVMCEMYQSYTRTDGNAMHFLADEVGSLWEDTASRESLLMQFVLDTVACHWIYEEPDVNDSSWDALFAQYPDLSRVFVRTLAGICTERTGGSNVKPLEAYLETFIKDEMEE